jgi:hypothetical protein
MVPSSLCEHCRKREASPDAIWWPFWMPIAVLAGGPWQAPKWCRECAGGYNFLGLLALAVMSVALFVVLVAVL